MSKYIPLLALGLLVGCGSSVEPEQPPKSDLPAQPPPQPTPEPAKRTLIQRPLLSASPQSIHTKPAGSHSHSCMAGSLLKK